MPVTQEENEKYRLYVSEVAHELGVFDFDAEQIVWHYTNSSGLLGILQSSTLHATQVSCLNDSNETKYATDLFHNIVQETLGEKAGDETSVRFLKNVLEFVAEENRHSTHGTSKFFVACFSGDEDEHAMGSLWRRQRLRDWLHRTRIVPTRQQ